VPFELKDDLQFSSAQCPAGQLITTTILLIPPNLIVGKETFNRFVKDHTVSGKFVPLDDLSNSFPLLWQSGDTESDIVTERQFGGCPQI
jgi:hypothetical protein